MRRVTRNERRGEYFACKVAKRAERTGEPRVSRREARREARRRTRVGRWLAIGAGTLAFAVLAFLFLRSGEGLSGAPSASPAVPYATPVLGDANAPVTIVEYGDFQCPSCGAFFRSVEPQLVAKYVNAGKAKLVFKHFPWIGPESKRAAEAASCAAAQGKFWEYHDLLYTNQHGENSGYLTADRLKGYASQLGLDRAAFDRCFDGGTYRAAVEADFNEVRRFGLNGTPTFVINGQRVVGAQSFAVFESVIESKLKGQ